MPDFKEKRNAASYSSISEPFGITSLDKKLNGSIKRGGLYLISGETGAGKTTLGIHSAIASAQQGEKCAIIVTAENAEEYVKNAKTFPGFAKYYDSGMILIEELSGNFWDLKFELYRNLNSKSLDAYLTSIEASIKQLLATGIKRLIIDSLTPLLPGNDKMGDMIHRVVDALAAPGVLTIAISEAAEGELSRYGIEEYYASGIIKLGVVGNEGKYAAKIVKMPGEYDSSPFYYVITSNGLEPITENERAILIKFKRGA
ncbi:MAG: ATPase domain-containing protein [Candidatus Micrarchaeaceae archaeon]